MTNVKENYTHHLHVWITAEQNKKLDQQSKKDTKLLKKMVNGKAPKIYKADLVREAISKFFGNK